MHLRRTCILLLLDGMIYKYQLSLSGLMCHLRLCVSLLIFFMDGLSIDVNVVLKFPTIFVFLSVSPFMAVSIFLIY